MSSRFFLSAGWLLPLILAVLFILKGQFYDTSFFVPPSVAVSSLPVPSTVGSWILEDGLSLPADRMFEKINGKAGYYEQYGAEGLYSGEWVLNEQRWDMYLYHFKTRQGALGAFNGERPSDGVPVEGVEGYAVPGQAAISVGRYYLQLNAFTAKADTDPAVELAAALVPHLQEDGLEASPESEIDLIALAGEDFAGDAEGFLPENAFGFSAFDNVRTVQVAMDGTESTWFTTSGDDALVAAYAAELAAYGGEDLFTENGASGGSMFGSWGLAGVLNGEVWGVQNASSRAALMQHWNALKEKLSAKARTL